MMEDMQQELKRSVKAAFDAVDKAVILPIFHYNSVTRRMHMTVPAGMFIRFPPSLERILGLTPEQNYICNRTEENISVIGNLPCDIQTEVHALYVYCDLLQYTHVGDIKAPLL